MACRLSDDAAFSRDVAIRRSQALHHRLFAALGAEFFGPAALTTVPDSSATAMPFSRPVGTVTMPSRMTSSRQSSRVSPFPVDEWLNNKLIGRSVWVDQLITCFAKDHDVTQFPCATINSPGAHATPSSTPSWDSSSSGALLLDVASATACASPMCSRYLARAMA